MTVQGSGVLRKKFRGVQGYGRPSRGSGGLSPPDAGEFSNIFEKFLKKIPKSSIFAYFAKKFQNPALIFRAFGRETQLVGEILRKI